jgi:hypothetical protein
MMVLQLTNQLQFILLGPRFTCAGRMRTAPKNCITTKTRSRSCNDHDQECGRSPLVYGASTDCEAGQIRSAADSQNSPQE